VSIRDGLKLLCENNESISGDGLENLINDILDTNPEAKELGYVNIEDYIYEKYKKRIIGMSFRRKYVYFDDLVLGRIKKPLDDIHEFVVVRSDGSPIFHLANVVDDVDMGITHVLRGNDHVENTFRHLFLYRAMGATPPCSHISR